jgi:hypothetical protein
LTKNEDSDNHTMQVVLIIKDSLVRIMAVIKFVLVSKLSSTNNVSNQALESICSSNDGFIDVDVAICHDDEMEMTRRYQNNIVHISIEALDMGTHPCHRLAFLVV